MKKILVLNCGSSSIKYRLFDEKFNTILWGLIERIGEKQPQIIHSKGDKKKKEKVNVKNHKQGIMLMFQMLHDKELGGIKRADEISVVGHRVVHGGQMAKTALVSGVALKYLKSFEMLAPLHNPNNIIGIKETKRIMPNVPQVMVFDTAFHQTMPRKAYMYALPYKFFDKYAIRKYGFHGTSHKYVSQVAGKMLKKKKPNLITCHLGAGSSITAVKKGESVDTSMGLTPLEGVMMATRTGDIDPAVVEYLVRRYGMKFEDVFEIMNKKSGLLGVSGVSKDVRIIEGKAKKGDERCRLALEMFSYRIAKYIAAYMAVLGKTDAIVFTAGIGENAFGIRKEICSYLKSFGIKLDLKKNRNTVKKRGAINAGSSRVKVLVVPTNEELMIAKEAVEMLGGK
ncbi:acetate kinase [Candidatus Micrarchaeota archaeon]|nr:acetate kinase [Candidatus Micrarchaeota archaeon]